MDFVVKGTLPSMENLKLLELPQLVDLLAEETSRYITMVKSGADREEFDTCKKKIKELQLEIEQRKTGNRQIKS